jgi:hypothetical protein
MRIVHRVQEHVKISPILVTIADPPDEKIIMAEIAGLTAVDRKSGHWYLCLNLRYNLVKKFLNT